MTRDERILLMRRYVENLAKSMDLRGLPLEDATQAGMLAVCQVVDRYDPARGATLFTFAYHFIVGAISDAVCAATDPEVYAPARVSHNPARFAEMIEGLEGQERGVLALRYVEDQTQDEVAALLGLERSWVSRIESRALARLREGAQLRGPASDGVDRHDNPQEGHYRYPAGGGHRVTRKPLRD